MSPISSTHPLSRLFAGLTEQTFFSELGITDTRLVDYLAELLTRFIHRDEIFRVGSPGGRQLIEIASMLAAIEGKDLTAEARHAVFRHVGDFALFWTGVYPEALLKRWSREALEDYSQQGKRGYYLASTYADTKDQAEQAPVLRRLSEEFDLCALGLRKVRAQWETAQA